MTTILMTLHVLVAIALIIVVLIQRGQGADIGASFGSGGAQTLFGSRGSGSFLGKLTGGLAATFMITSLTLAFFTQQNVISVVERAAPIEQPALPSSDAESSRPAFDPTSLKATGQALPANNTKTSKSASIEIPISDGQKDPQETSAPSSKSTDDVPLPTAGDK
ncbi:MAG: preprotein translocase subunit SecG [Mariprofundaceae bacterium]|nr:preprotein translocase subunit SecG [Mariprofundaceae bacterium]